MAGQDYVIEPDDDGFDDFPVEFTFARMNIVTANSMREHMLAAGTFKADFLFRGPYLNDAQQRQLLIEMPALQIVSWKAPVTDHNQVKPGRHAQDAHAGCQRRRCPGMPFSRAGPDHAHECPGRPASSTTRHSRVTTVRR